MKRYEVVDKYVSFHSGILELSSEQASARATALRDLGDGLFEIVQPVQFKCGETVGYDGGVDKALQPLLRETKRNPGGARQAFGKKTAGPPEALKKQTIAECKAAIESARAEAQEIIRQAQAEAADIVAFAKEEAAEIVAAAKGEAEGAAATGKAADLNPETAG